MSKAKRIQWLMNCIVVCVISASLSSALLESIFLPYNFIGVLIISFVIYAVLSEANNKKRIFTVLTVGFVLFIISLALRSYERINGVWAFIFWQFRYFTVYVDEPMFVTTTIIFWTGIITTVYFLLIVKKSWFLMPAIFGLAILAVLWAFDHNEILPFIWLFALGTIIHWVGSYEKSVCRRNAVPFSGLWQVYVLPLAILIILTSCFLLPKDTEQYKWANLIEWLKSIDIIPDEYSLFESTNSYRLSDSGFLSSTNKLGGPVELDDTIVMEVNSSVPLYLRGAVLNYYDGSRWHDKTDKKKYYKMGDHQWSSERMAAFNYDELAWISKGEHIGLNEVINIHNFSKLYPMVHPIINHVGMETKTLFNVMQTQYIFTEDTEFPVFFNNQGETFSLVDIPEDKGYSIFAFVPRMANEDFLYYLKTYSPLLDWDQKSSIEKYYSEDYGEKLIDIQSNYMNIHKRVPDRVIELAQSITKNEPTAIEKVMTIQYYLEKNYEYSLTPRSTPFRRDFVDYFLFDLKEGYCTYFATAMTIMVRAAGIPARYVEGFAMPSESNEKGVYEVRNLHGHAWVEVYFPNFGWLPFDPTPAVNTRAFGAYTDDDTWDDYWTDAFNPTLPGGIPVPMPTPEVTPEPEPEPTVQPTISPTPLDKDDKPSTNNTETRTVNVWAVIIAAGSVVIIVVFSALLLILPNKLFWKRVKNQDYNKQVYIYYNEILWLLDIYGTSLERGETPYEYADKVDKWLVNPVGSMMDVTMQLVKSQYGNHQLTDDDMEFVKSFYTSLRNSAFELFGKVKMYLREVNRRLKG